MSTQVVFTGTAKNDLREIAVHLAKRSGSRFCGDWMAPKSRMSWAVAFVMNAPPKPKRSVYVTPW